MLEVEAGWQPGEPLGVPPGVSEISAKNDSATDPATGKKFTATKGEANTELE